MDTPRWIIIAIAVVTVIALAVYRYGREIALNVKGWGVQAKLQAKGEEHAAKAREESRNVSIGKDARRNLIVTGDGTAAATTGAGRNVST